VLVLILIGLLAGIVTAISPCVLPVLPVLLAGGASGRKPLRIVAGLVVSFSVFTLFASWLLRQLGLPQDLLRNLAIVLLFVMAGVLLLPQAALLLERSLSFFSRLRPANAGGGFFLGATLGLVFVPCAGPFLAAITTAAARENFGGRTIAATVAYALGAAIPMLAIAYGGREMSARIRMHAERLRMASGVIVALVAIGLVFHLDDHLAQLTPGYTTFLQNKIEQSSAAQRELAKVRGGGAVLTAKKTTAKGGLPDYGVAPALHADGAWINSKPLTIKQLRGKVVLVDFWTYSCINCLRTLPHLKAWDATYRSKGLVIIGVHTPEFAFEHVTSNVRSAVQRLGIRYPVVQDNSYKTWDNYANQYWPAEYLIDRSGHVRHTNFGEGEYPQTEALIRRLLAVNGKRAQQLPDTTPTEAMTPETYLGYTRIGNYIGSQIVPDKPARYTFTSNLFANAFSYDGTWRVGGEKITAIKDARLRLDFQAKDVYLVLGGKGTVQVLIDGKHTKTLRVDAERLYTVRASGTLATHALLELRFSPGVQAYSFTFG
jgi:cytochrome c biogenesis protein CcdA/thiol-disulfide isomerase/thioredoxin